MSSATFDRALADGQCTADEALALFDSLPAVPPDAMIGSWRGAGFPTAHPLDGVLEAFHWYGKRFVDLENVHPLIFTSRSGKHWSINPVWALPLVGILAGERIPKWRWLGTLFQWLLPVFSTRRSRARLRATEYRGLSSATMSYDNLPINDVFRQIDADTMLGAMDLKGMARPFFFILRREGTR
tara:strand:+ start:6256 stop:6807 length:552 start_codon:yes stop_codon:yes gene_type:complete